MKATKTRILQIVYYALAILFFVLCLTLRFDEGTIYYTGLVPELSNLYIPENSVWHIVLLFGSTFACIAESYFIGSTNFAIIISKECYNDDIRRHGSKNAGMTNMFRVYGKKAGIDTLIGDSSKTFLSIFFGRFLLGEFGAYLAAMFCVIGHIAPIRYKFKGGKGVLSSAIAMLALNPIYFLIEIAVFSIVYFTSHYVSMGSVTAAFVYPAVVFYGAKAGTGGEGIAPFPAIIFAFFVGVMVLVTHRANLKRVYHGEEKKMYLRHHDEKPKKEKKKDSEI